MYDRYFEQAAYATEGSLVSTLIAYMYNEGYIGDVETFDSIDAIENGEPALTILKSLLETAEEV